MTRPVRPDRTVAEVLALNVVNAPVLAVVAPMAVEFRPVEVSVARVANVPARFVPKKSWPVFAATWSY
jgi:hypothetical protein